MPKLSKPFTFLLSSALSSVLGCTTLFGIDNIEPMLDAAANAAVDAGSLADGPTDSHPLEHGALEFADGHVAIVRSTSELTGFTFTVEFWAKPTPNGRGVLFSRVNADESWEVSVYDGFVRLFVDRGVTAYVITDPLPAGQWHHIAAGQDLISGSLWMCVFDSCSDIEASLNDSSGKDIWLGDSSVANEDAPFTGQLDEVRLWSERRSLLALQTNRYSEITSTLPNLAGYWRFNETVDDQEIRDSADGESDGTLGASIALETVDPTRVVSDSPIVPAAP